MPFSPEAAELRQRAKQLEAEARAARAKPNAELQAARAEALRLKNALAAERLRLAKMRADSYAERLAVQKRNAELREQALKDREVRRKFAARNRMTAREREEHDMLVRQQLHAQAHANTPDPTPDQLRQQAALVRPPAMVSHPAPGTPATPPTPLIDFGDD